MPSSRKKIVNKKQSEKRNLRRNNKKKKRSLRKKSKKLTGGDNLDELVTTAVTKLCPNKGSCKSESEFFKEDLMDIVRPIGNTNGGNVIIKKLLFESYLKLIKLFKTYNIDREQGLQKVEDIYQKLENIQFESTNNGKLSLEEFEENRKKGISMLSAIKEDLKGAVKHRKDLGNYIDERYGYFFKKPTPEVELEDIYKGPPSVVNNINPMHNGKTQDEFEEIRRNQSSRVDNINPYYDGMTQDEFEKARRENPDLDSLLKEIKRENEKKESLTEEYIEQKFGPFFERLGHES